MENKANMLMRVMITGATGMVGEGVLMECLESDFVSEVLIVNRKASGFSHPKLKELIHADFFDISPIAAQLVGYDACFFCLGVSSVGMKEPEYRHLTYDLTMHVAEVLSAQNPQMTFCYVSGAGTDSSEKGRSMWARVKGKTENDLQKLPFRQVYNFRPGLMKPRKNAKNASPYYKYISWLYRPVRALGGATTLAELGQAMINVSLRKYSKAVIEIKDIIELSKA